MPTPESHVATPAPSLTYEIEENYPRQLSPKEIEDIRSQTLKEALRVMNPPFAVVDVSGTKVPSMEEKPEPIIREREKSWQDVKQQREQMRRQLNVCVRHIDELLAIDEEIAGNPETGSKGLKLPVLRLGQHGKHSAVIRTNNTWGAVPVEEDEELQARLKNQCTVADASGTLTLDAEAYRRALVAYRRDHAHADLPVLGEDDRVDIFDAKEEHIGSAVVREVSGDTVRLHFSTPVRLKKGFTLRKRSNRQALLTYKEYVHTYSKRLNCTHHMTNRAGELVWASDWEENAEPPSPRKRRGMNGDATREAHELEGLSVPEAFFFGEEELYDLEDELRSLALRQPLAQQDIPREILDDAEQCCAFALGAMGHPCMLIQGPAGTGKTTVTSLLTKRFQEQGKRTLILSHSNRGLDTLLKAARKKGVALHRGGSEEGSCDVSLRDIFIRKGLKSPRWPEYMVPVFDHEAFARAQKAYDPATGKPSPTREDFTTMELNQARWHAAWEEFEQRKKLLLEELRAEDGLTVGVTLNSLISDEIIQELDFDIVIVDEASRGFLYEFLPALEKAGKQIIFIGDHKQLGNIDLPPVLKKHLEDPPEQQVQTTEENPRALRAEDIGIFEGGPFTYLAENESVPQIMLRTNRRALMDLVRVVSWGTYGGKLKAGRMDHEHPENTGSLLWVDTSGRPDRGEIPSGVSRINPLEARLVARRLMDEFERGELSQGDFGVIAMYRAQANQIFRKARKTHPKHGGIRAQFLEALRGNVATVDSFQGSEQGTIHLATTRSNKEGVVGFLEDARRTNVAGSRARDRMVVYGDPKTLIEENPDPESAAYFRVLYEICKQRGRIVAAFPTLPGAVRPESEKSQTRNARWKRRRRAKRKEAQT